MEDLYELVKKWDIQRINDPNVIREDQNFYQETYNYISKLAEFKFKAYEPWSIPIVKMFLTRLTEWLNQFDENHQKFLFYLASKIIFYTRKQIDHLMRNIFHRKIKKIILDEIIDENSSTLTQYSYLGASTFLRDELDKTLFVPFTDSANINGFCHLNPEIDRLKSTDTHINFSTLFYPILKKYDLVDQNIINTLEKFEKDFILNLDILKNKKRLVIIEDNCCSGSDFINNCLRYLDETDFNFKTIIFAPFIITYKGKEMIENWVESNKSHKYNFFLVYGSLIPVENQCFDNHDSYLKPDWKDNNYNICEEIKQICIDTYESQFPKEEHYKFGFNNLKLAFVTYYNCPDTTLPIIWFPNDGNWKPLFKRSSRMI